MTVLNSDILSVFKIQKLSNIKKEKKNFTIFSLYVSGNTVTKQNDSNYEIQYNL